MLASKIKEIRNGRVITKDEEYFNGIHIGKGKILYEKGGYVIAQYGNGILLKSSKGASVAVATLEDGKRRIEKAIQAGGLYADSKTKDLNLLPEEVVRIVMKKAGVSKSIAERAVSKLLESGEVSAGLSEAAILKKAQPFLPINDSKTKDKKMRDGQSYNMAVEYELFTYYNIPRNQARQIVERNSQELQKKEDAGVSARNAADMLIHKEGIKGFEKIYVRPNDSKTKDSETAESLLRQFKARRLLDDRREYDVEDFMSTYDLPRAEAQKLFDMVQKATRDSKTKDMVDSNVISDTLDDIKAGKDPNRAFAAALEDNNFYGPKSKQDRVDMANALRSKGINVNLATVEKMLGISDSKDAIDPTKPKTIAAAKSLSVAQGKAATGDSKPIKRHLVKTKDESELQKIEQHMESEYSKVRTFSKQEIFNYLTRLGFSGGAIQTYIQKIVNRPTLIK